MKVRIKGFSVIELLLVVSILSFFMVFFIKQLTESNKQTQISEIASKIVNVIGAVDQRIYIDGYSSLLWPETKEYISNIQVNNFLKSQLISSKAKCGISSNGWNPHIEDNTNEEEIDYKENLQLLSCEPWTSSGTMNFGIESALKIVENSNEINDIFLTLYLENNNSFDENILTLRKILSKAKELDTNNSTGSHSYYLVNLNNTDYELNSITIRECITIKEKCAIVARYSSSGNGFEYLNVTGTNSMIDTKLSFVSESGGSVVNTCVAYEKDASNNWVRIENITCGVGIDKDKNTNYVDADVHGVSANRISLDRLCEFRFYNGGVSEVSTVPCGMSTEYGLNEAVVAINNISAQNGYTELLNVKNINTENLSVLKEMNVEGETNLNILNVDGLSTFNEKVELKSDGNIAKDLFVAGETQIDFLKVIDEAIFEKTVTVHGNVETDGYVKADHLILESVTENDLGEDCSSFAEGAMKIYRDGSHSEPAICTEYEDIDGNKKLAWKLANVRIGQIIPFDGTCPSGFTYFTEASGRFLIGENEEYLDGLTAAELAEEIDSGNVFLDADGNVLRYKLGDNGGEAFHKLTIEEMPSHNHEMPTIKATCTGVDCAGFAMTELSAMNTVWSRETEIPTNFTGGDMAHENRPPFYVVNYCIYEGK